MRYILILPVLIAVLSIDAKAQGPKVVPTVITNHYDKSEIESHGVVTVTEAEKKIKVEVKDLRKNAGYDVVLLDEATGKRSKVGTLKTDAKGFSSAEFSIKDLFPAHNALLLMNGDDVVQYAQLLDSHHGCICKHSGGSIVTRNLDQECFECPCGVKYEICCGGKR
jgi:hypothetical protein